jgi:Na+(H+)/acetate symporter ActP
MVGTAALPHILMRYYTTPSVKEARQSVTWSLFFIFLLYFTAPALAVLVEVRGLQRAGGHAVRQAASLGGEPGRRSTRRLLSCFRHQQGRHPAAR